MVFLNLRRKMIIPPNQADSCAFARVLMNFVALDASAAPPPDFSMSPTKPPMKKSKTNTAAL